MRVKERQRPRGRYKEGGKQEEEEKKETLTHKLFKVGSSFDQQLRAFDKIFSYPPLKSLPHKESNYMSRTIPHSTNISSLSRLRLSHTTLFPDARHKNRLSHIYYYWRKRRWSEIEQKQLSQCVRRQIRNAMHDVLCKHEFEIDTDDKISRNKQLVR